MDILDLVQRIRRTNDYERRIHGAMRLHLNAHMDKWVNDNLPDKLNNNFFAPLAGVSREDIELAVRMQKQTNHSALMFRMTRPMDEALVRAYGFETEVTHVMALLEDNSAAWRTNPDILIRDNQQEDLTAAMLDVSTTPYEYRAAALRSMKQAVQVSKKHPEYHWLFAYQNGKPVGSCYALCKNGVIEMDDLEVHEAHRGQYIATTLLKHITQNFEGTMYLHADAAASVHDMYARMGFTTVDTLYDYYLEW